MKLFVYSIILICSIVSVNAEHKPSLATIGYNVYSQFGEDGILEKIFDRIGTTTKLCVEFGAADGFDCSNTARLWSEQEWRAILIEGAPDRYQQLVANVSRYPQCILINRYIDTNNNSLEKILAEHNITQQIDLLSIDIDGDDYYILQGLQLKPRVIICEYNPTIPASLDIYPNYHNRMGSSPQSLARIAREKGYTLVAVTDTNCIFIQDEDVDKFSDFEIDLDKIQVTYYLKYLINSYDGQYLVVGQWEKTPWLGLNSRYDKPLNGSFKVLPVGIN